MTNVRVYVYRPSFENRDAITALVVWNALNEVEAGGIVNYYSVIIDDADTFVSLCFMYIYNIVIIFVRLC